MIRNHSRHGSRFPITTAKLVPPISYLIVGGGAAGVDQNAFIGGPGYPGGGGGGGGVVFGTTLAGIAGNVLTIVVGAGGTGGTDGAAADFAGGGGGTTDRCTCGWPVSFFWSQFSTSCKNFFLCSSSASADFISIFLTGLGMPPKYPSFFAG
jgi:hypothetical protein